MNPKTRYLVRVLTWLGAAALALLPILFLTGCQSTPVMVRPATTNEVVLIRTNVLHVVSTNLVANPTPDGLWMTNFVVSTNTVLSLSTNVVTLIAPPVFYTNISLAGWVEPAARLAGDVAPIPGGSGVAGVSLGIIGTVLALINQRRRKKALGEAASWQETAAELVRNVESVRKQAMLIPGYTPEIDSKIVRGLELSQWATGTKPRIVSLVDQHTDYTSSA